METMVSSGNLHMDVSRKEAFQSGLIILEFIKSADVH